VPTCAQ